MHKEFRGDCIYQAETDVHFPLLTVGQTLSLAAEARAPRNAPGRSIRNNLVKTTRDAIVGGLDLKHTMDTNVGNDFLLGVSGGERKRVSIAVRIVISGLKAVVNDIPRRFS